MKNKDEKLYRADAVTVPKLVPISKGKEKELKELISEQKSKETISKRNSIFQKSIKLLH